MARTEKFTRDHHDKDSMMLELCICRKKTHQQELGMIIYIYIWVNGWFYVCQMVRVPFRQFPPLLGQNKEIQ